MLMMLIIDDDQQTNNDNNDYDTKTDNLLYYNRNRLANYDVDVC